MRRPLACLIVSVFAIAAFPSLRAEAQSANAERKGTRTISVTKLPTVYGTGDEDTFAYPRTIAVEVPPSVKVGAYGAAQQVWLGPPSWTGQATVGADGNVSIQLYPLPTDRSSWSHIEYLVTPDCVVCILGRASAYFPEVLKRYNQSFNSEQRNPVLPPGTSITRVSPSLVHYAMPDEDGLAVRGAAFYDDGVQPFFQEVELRLPRRDEATISFLLTYFAEHIGP